MFEWGLGKLMPGYKEDSERDWEHDLIKAEKR